MVKKLITLDGLAVFLSELRKEINAGSGKCFDAEELARRIPSWQWKVTMPKTTRQTVTATVGSETYTDDFYAPQGSQVAFSAKADTGYIAGNLSTASTTLSKDLIVTITAAVESEEVEAGTKTLGGRSETFTVPPKVHVIKCLWCSKDVYVKVNPGDILRIYFNRRPKPEDKYTYTFRSVTIIPKDGSGERYLDDNMLLKGVSSHTLKISWSTEINEHAFDYDWTWGGNSGKIVDPDESDDGSEVNPPTRIIP